MTVIKSLMCNSQASPIGIVIHEEYNCIYILNEDGTTNYDEVTWERYRGW